MFNKAKKNRNNEQQKATTEIKWVHSEWERERHKHFSSTLWNSDCNNRFFQFERLEII